MNLLTIFWGADVGFEIGGFTLRWYSLLFATGFILGYQIVKKIFLKEGIDIKLLDTLLTYAVVATIVGARLGHCLFYDWEYYSQHPIEIFKVWQGGLASHGAAIALIIAMYFYGKKLSHYFSGKNRIKLAMFYSLDRLVITVALAGAFIRFGNWMNSEIYGRMENSSIETVFTRLIQKPLGEVNFEESIDHGTVTSTGETYATDSIHYPELSITVFPISPLNEAEMQSLFGHLKNYYNHLIPDEQNAIVLADAAPVMNPDGSFSFIALGVPRLPTQLIESLGYFIIFIVLYTLFHQKVFAMKNGFLFGTFLVLVFGFRFVIEFWKANQSAFEADLTLNMGQILSIPLVLLGLFMMLVAKPTEITHSTK